MNGFAICLADEKEHDDDEDDDVVDLALSLDGEEEVGLMMMDGGIAGEDLVREPFPAGARISNFRGT